MNAEEYLQQVEKIDKIIKNKLLEKEQWLDMARSTAAPGFGEKVQSSPNPNRMSYAVERFCDIENEINAYIDLLYDTKRDVVSVIESLKTSEYELLHHIYIQYHTLKEAAKEMSRSYSWVKTNHSIALQNVQKILDKRSNYDTYNRKNE